MSFERCWRTLCKEKEPHSRAALSISFKQRIEALAWFHSLRMSQVCLADSILGSACVERGDTKRLAWQPERLHAAIRRHRRVVADHITTHLHSPYMLRWQIDVYEFDSRLRRGPRNILPVDFSYPGSSTWVNMIEIRTLMMTPLEAKCSS